MHYLEIPRATAHLIRGHLMARSVTTMFRTSCTLLLTLLVFNPLWADDTEIFFGRTTNHETQPNVLFILDGSGSMNWYDCANGQVWSVPCVGGTTTRLERLRSALTTVLQSSSNINVGLMRFSRSNAGGRIIYPMRPIDQQLCNGVPCDESTTFSTQSRVSSGADDAVQQSSGAVVINDTSLALMSLNGLPFGNSMVGLRFPDLQIPQGATITDARLDFGAVNNDDTPTSLTIRAEDSADAKVFTNTTNDISNRNTIYNSVSWNALPEWENEESYESPNISTLIQSVVSKSDWCGGNAIGLSITGNGNRLAASFDLGAANGPVLRVEYNLSNVPPTGGCTTSTVVRRIDGNNDDAEERKTASWSSNNGRIYRNFGEVLMRAYPSYSNGYSPALAFSNVTIPQNSEVVDATLTVVTRSQSYNSGSLSVNIRAQNSGNPAAIGTSKFDLSQRPRVSSTVEWPDISATVGDTSVSPSIKDMVNTIVNRGDWTSGNRMVFFLEPGSGGGQRAIASHDGSAANAALLRVKIKTFIRSAAEKISGPVTDVRTEIINQLDDMVANHGTPTVGALVEAQRYFAGDHVHYGLNREPIWEDTQWPSYEGRYSRVSHPESYIGGTVVRDSRCLSNAMNGKYCAGEVITGDPVYKSPITHECQSNHIVLLTDGSPTADPGSITDVQNLTGGGCDAEALDEGTCGEEIAEYMNTVDQNNSLDSKQVVRTHTIGFNFNTTWLEDLADSGGGGFYTADSAAELSIAFANILDSVQNVNTTFVAPGATVDHFSKISHRNDLYLALFKPQISPSWIGNLKRFDILGDPPELHDVNGEPAVDPVSGQFFETSKSHWSDTTDGNDVAKGGAAGQLDHTSRMVYSNLTDQADLSLLNNRVVGTNELITPGHFNLNAADTDFRDDLLDWAQGRDVKDENDDGSTSDSRKRIGDPLHSRPVIITYDGPSADPDSVILFGTNEGYLHAISTDTGEEIYSFIPQDLLPKLPVIFEANPASDKVYGLDGGLALWTQDNNYNGIIEDEDHVYLYLGMRRGGSSYYALDISDKDEPHFKWQISAGDAGFSELGQTWSHPVVTTINYLGDTKKVLIFGGGYDDSQDDKTTRSEDGIGRAVYIVDADTKALLWSGGHADGSPTKTFSDMQYSIPATVKPIDGDGDGLVEQFYVGDMGGQLWRFDINQNTSDVDALVSGGVIADLAEDLEPENTRRFYHTPDISISLREGVYMLNIAIGSGYQAHPLDTTISDRFYAIRYPYVLPAGSTYGMPDENSSAGAYRAIEEDDLFDATSNVIGQGTPKEIADAEAELLASKGWFIEMERSGEKVLGPSLTFNNRVMFASYIPGGITQGCAPQLGSGVFWAVNLWDATPVENFDDVDPENTVITEQQLYKPDRHKPVPGSGIPPPVQILLLQGEDGETISVVTTTGPHRMMEDDAGSLVDRIYWSETPDF